MLLKGVCAFALLLFLCSPSFAADDSMLKGDAAYDKGYYTEASEFYKKAAEQGNAEAQNRLGLLYHTGEGVPQDHAEAEKWFRKSAEQGNEEAKLNLRYSYANITEVNPAKDDIKTEEPATKSHSPKKPASKKRNAKKMRKKRF